MHKRISGDLTKAREHLKHTTSPQQQAARSSSSSGADAADSNSSPGAASATKPAAAAAAASPAGSGGVTPRPSPAAAAAAAAASPGDTPAAAAAAAAAADAEQQAVYVERVTQLLADSGVKIQGMQSKMDGAIRAFKFTVEYFCEDAALGWKQQPAAFIAHFADLLESIEAARKDTGRVAKVGRGFCFGRGKQGRKGGPRDVRWGAQGHRVRGRGGEEGYQACMCVGARGAHGYRAWRRCLWS
jgi:hypothetical protein